ncbi:unnamed protein product [Effrenium voratum]|uniref:Uncharacterized protein n=1 Tax=Effrenium voratum TaxID=2562239 RepID=A0AA36IBR8_9DINO|nr:unnamed protein product [Effrenium voratum]
MSNGTLRLGAQLTNYNFNDLTLRHTLSNGYMWDYHLLIKTRQLLHVYSVHHNDGAEILNYMSEPNTVQARQDLRQSQPDYWRNRATFLSIHSHLEEWTHQLRQSRAAWHAARLQVVPRVAVPAGLLKLVHELGTSNLATGPVVVLSADNLRQLVAKRQGVNLSQLHVFEGPWGELSFSEAKDWKVLMQDNLSLSQSLQNLAKRTFGRQLWGDSPEFHGAAFLLHHQRAHLVSAAQVGVVSNAAAVAKSPAEFLKWVIEEFWEQLGKDEMLRQEQLKEQSFDPVDSEPMSNESDESDEWQLVVVGVSRKGEMYTDASDDEYGPNSCRDCQILAECVALMGICSEPVVFAKELESQPEGDACLQMELREKLTIATTRMKQKNIKKMMVYYGGHGESIDEDRTVSCELGLVLEDEVVRAVEMAMLEYVCAIVLLDSSRCLSLCHAYSSPPDRSPTNTYVFGYFCQFGDCMRASSLVPAALMHMMQAEKDDCDISFFLIRLKRLLLHITGGRTDMQLAGPLQRAADQEFFPAGCRKLKLPFERAKVNGLLDEEYEALRDTFAMYGHCDCIMDNMYLTGVILQEMLEDAKQMVEQDGESHVPASKHTLRHLIPQLERIAKVFHTKKELFRSDWRREFEAVALQEVGRTSFDHVLQQLEELTEESEYLGSGSSWPRIPEDVRRCVVEARHRYYRKEGEQDLMSISHVSEVLPMLSKYFTPLPPLDSASCVLTDDLEEQVFRTVFIYKLTIHISASCVDGSFLVNKNQQLAQLDHLHKHFTKNYTETNAYEIEICIDFG